MIQGYLKLNGLSSTEKNTQEQIVSVMYDADSVESKNKAIQSVVKDYLNFTSAEKIIAVVYEPVATKVYFEDDWQKEIPQPKIENDFSEYQKVKLYLDWSNNWISPTAFMDHYSLLNRAEFDKIIDKGRELNHQLNPKK